MYPRKSYLTVNGRTIARIPSRLSDWLYSLPYGPRFTFSVDA